MNARWPIYLTLPLVLTGCISKAAKIVDLSAAVFIIFLALVGFKLAFPHIAKTAHFRRFADVLTGWIPVGVKILYFSSTGLVAYGVIAAGIHRVLIFNGFTLALIAVMLTRYRQAHDQEEKRRLLEIVMLAVGVFAVLTLLWMFGADLFAGL